MSLGRALPHGVSYPSFRIVMKCCSLVLLTVVLDYNHGYSKVNELHRVKLLTYLLHGAQSFLRS